MHNRCRLSKSLAGICLCLLVCASASGQSPSWQTDLAAWRTEHAAELLKPDGWLSLVGLEWLEPGDTAFGSAPDNKIHLGAGSPVHLGILHLEKETVTLLPPSEGFPKDLLLEAAPAKSTDAPPSDVADNPALRRIASAVIRRLPASELREVWLPLGYVLDEIGEK